MPRTKLPTDAALRARAKRLFERGASVDDLAPMLGMGRRTLYHRIAEWGWRRPVPRPGTRRAPGSPEPAAGRSAELPLPPAGLPAWLEQAAATVDVESLERNARRLSALAASLAAIHKIEAHRARPAADLPPLADEPPDDIEEFRRELARRLAALAAATRS